MLRIPACTHTVWKPSGTVYTLPSLNSGTCTLFLNLAVTCSLCLLFFWCADGTSLMNVNLNSVQVSRYNSAKQILKLHITLQHAVPQTRSGILYIQLLLLSKIAWGFLISMYCKKFLYIVCVLCYIHIYYICNLKRIYLKMPLPSQHS